jgi:hypothetical protein
MLQKTILIVFSSILVLGFSSCDKKSINAYQCILINKDEQAQEKPLDEWYWFCKNQYTQEKKSIWLKDSVKCIRDQEKECKWYGTDVMEFEIVKKALKVKQ